ncbi:MAG: hypothetical protein RBU30_12890 [Polyangia bacterium]|nr:hypothetical protein [Polyangia bacterium]
MSSGRTACGPPVSHGRDPGEAAEKELRWRKLDFMAVSGAPHSHLRVETATPPGSPSLTWDRETHRSDLGAASF